MTRGEVWIVDLDPGRTFEQQKRRPAVVVNIADVGTLPLRVIVPVTAWKDGFAGKPWLIRIEPTGENGLAKTSAADTFQIRSVEQSRFGRRLGTLTESEMQQIAAAIARMVGA